MTGKIIGWPLCFGLLFGSAISYAQDFERQRDLPFSAGEKLTYHVRWGILPIGTAVLWVRNVVEVGGKKAYHISAEGRSNAFLSAFYEVDDLVQSFWDASEFYSLAFQKIQNEGHYHINEIYLFDHGRRKVIWYNTKRRAREFEMPAGVQDALSCLYEFRRMNFRPGFSTAMDVHQDEKNYKVSVDSLEREEVKVPALGRVETICVEPRAEHEGMFLRKGHMWVWFTDDGERIPVRVQVKAPIFGRLTAELKLMEHELEPQPSAAAAAVIQFQEKTKTIFEAKEISAP